MASSGQRSNPAAAGHGPHGRSRSQVPRHMLQIAMHCQPLLGDPSQLLLPKKRISQNYQGSQAPKMRLSDSVRLVVCDLSASPFIDLAGSRMLHELHAKLAARGIALRIVGAHGWVRDLLRADGLGEKVGGLDRMATLDRLLSGEGGTVSN